MRNRFQTKRYRLKGFIPREKVEGIYSRRQAKNYLAHGFTILVIVALLAFLWFWLQPMSLITELSRSLGMQ